MEPTPVLYDADCRFCLASLALLLAWDRRRRLRPVPLQGQEAPALLPGMSPEQRIASLHVAPATGPPLSGAAAVESILRELPGGSPLGAVAGRLPRATQKGYEWVAANRARLSRLVPRPVSGRVDDLVRSRS